MIEEIKQELQEQWFAYLIILVYIVLLAMVIRGHEMWFDELQAWTISRDNDLFSLVFNYLRYEGHPPLWYLILFIPAHLRFPPQTVSLISALFAALGISLFTRFSPFPPIIKLLLPFSFYVFYQYGVIARNYSLILFLFSLVALVYPRRFKHPIIYSIILCLLVQLHLITAVVAGVFFAFFLLDVLRHKHYRKGLIPYVYSLIIFLFNMVLAALVLFPRPLDADFPSTGLLSGYLDVNASTTIGLNLLNNSYTGTGVISGVALLIMFVYLYQKKSLMIFLASTIAVVTFLGIIYSAKWHEGIIFLVLILCLWIAADNKTKTSRLVSVTMQITLAVVLLVQVYWTITASYSDLTGPYSGSQQMAKYLAGKKLLNEDIKFISFNVRSIYAYLPESAYLRNPSLVDQRAYFFWSTTNPWQLDPEMITSKYIIGSAKFSDEVRDIDGYTIEYIAYGSMFWKDTYVERDTLILYRKL